MQLKKAIITKYFENGNNKGKMTLQRNQIVWFESLFWLKVIK